MRADGLLSPPSPRSLVQVVVASCGDDLGWTSALAQFDVLVLDKCPNGTADDLGIDAAARQRLRARLGRGTLLDQAGSRGSRSPQPSTLTLPNCGREAHAYLSYIVRMYDALPPLVAFLQGDMPRHVRGSRIKALPEQLQLLLLNGTSFAHLAGRPLWSVQQHSEWSSLGRFCEMYRLFGARDAGRLASRARGGCKLWLSITHAHFVVARSTIRRHARSRYEALLRMFETERGCTPGHVPLATFMERSWALIFGCTRLMRCGPLHPAMTRGQFDEQCPGVLNRTHLPPADSKALRPGERQPRGCQEVHWPGLLPLRPPVLAGHCALPGFSQLPSPPQLLWQPQRSIWAGALSISYCNLSRPVMVFTAGAPGSGKTYTLHALFGLDRVEMLDLDTVMPSHPSYNASRPEALYTQPDAYRWANERVEERFQQILREPSLPASGDDGPAKSRFVCVDGTGTHVERQRRRMWAAKRAGFWIVNLHVRVSLATCLERNRNRSRSVPEAILRDYIDRLEAAVAALQGEPGLVDEYVLANNDLPDRFATEAERWGEHYERVAATAKNHAQLFDPAANPVADPNPWPVDWASEPAKGHD